MTLLPDPSAPLPIRRRVPLALPANWEIPTLALFAGNGVLWAAGLEWLSAVSLPLGIAVVAVALVLHASLSHEILHDHPFRSRRANTALGIVQPGLVVPYLRFRDLHLAHHRDAALTDPYDDPESNYLDPDVWARLPHWRRVILQANNTLAGRMVLGPVLSQWRFVSDDITAGRRGDRAVLRGWLWHLPGVVGVLAVVWQAAMPLWAYAAAIYAALSILRIRTFLEHRAHAQARGRTVIVEDRGPLAFLFLNNNLHVVHHMHPKVAWYRLPALYRARRSHYLRRNDGYLYRSYAQVFATHFWRTKDPVAHPLWPRR